MGDKLLSVSFIMPMYNERENIENSVMTLKALAPALTDEYEIVIVDDGSADGSGDIADALAREDARVVSVRLPRNTKFGGALAAGLARASKDVILYTDSDLPVKIGDIKKSFPLIASSDIVTGYSMIKKGDTFFRKLMSYVYNALVKILFGLSVRDINSGYKVMRRGILEGAKFVSRSPFVDVEIFLHVRKKGGRIEQYPLVFYPRTSGKSYMARLPIILAAFRDMLKVWFLYSGFRFP